MFILYSEWLIVIIATSMYSKPDVVDVENVEEEEEGEHRLLSCTATTADMDVVHTPQALKRWDISMSTASMMSTGSSTMDASQDDMSVQNSPLISSSRINNHDQEHVTPNGDGDVSTRPEEITITASSEVSDTNNPSTIQQDRSPTIQNRSPATDRIKGSGGVSRSPGILKRVVGDARFQQSPGGRVSFNENITVEDIKADGTETPRDSATTTTTTTTTSSGEPTENTNDGEMDQTERDESEAGPSDTSKTKQERTKLDDISTVASNIATILTEQQNKPDTVITVDSPNPITASIEYELQEIQVAEMYPDIEAYERDATETVQMVGEKVEGGEAVEVKPVKADPLVRKEIVRAAVVAIIVVIVVLVFVLR